MAHARLPSAPFAGALMILRLSTPLLAAALLLLAGCASKPQLPVSMVPITASSAQRVGVALAKVPKASMEVPGAECPLCIASAQVANLPLARHVDTLDAEQLKPVRDQIAAALRKKGVDVTVIPEAIEIEALAEISSPAANSPRRNFAPLKQKYGVDKLVVVGVQAVGIQRSYMTYVPTSAPRVFVRAAGYMVNLGSNVYEWYLPVHVVKAAEGRHWDEPPNFPALTNAYYRALEQGGDRLLEPWSQ
jgi:hypothetical protein